MPASSPTPSASDSSSSDLSQTTILLANVRAGDGDALEQLFTRFRPRLAAWLRQRVPSHARSLEDTQDLVQDVCMKAFGALERFERRGIGSFWMFLRTTAHHHLVDVVRRRKRESGKEPIPEDSQLVPAAAVRSPVSGAEDHEVALAFEQALQALPERTRQAVAMRLELDCDYATIAADCGFASPDAARVAIARAITAVAKAMKSHDESHA